jgi:hypothetical protein
MNNTIFKNCFKIFTNIVLKLNNIKIVFIYIKLKYILHIEKVLFHS